VSYQVFARKYRPRTFDDVLGQDHVVRTLRNAITQKRLAHAYLFVGPRGTGKTSTARILAKALNCTGGPKADFDPDEDVCIEIAEGRSLDVLEIDGASNNGVEQVRDLRESVRFAPARGQFKIYYIDEVHMLSNAAFNALLKTLEEPPPHVKFIFATTEINKVPVTILSRCQRFDLKRLDAALLASHYANIAEKEAVEAEPDALAMIARAAEGSVRDGLSLLDQAIAYGGDTVRAGDVASMLGMMDRSRIIDLYAAVMGGDTAAAIHEIEDQYHNGGDPRAILTDLADYVHWVTRLKVVKDQALSDTSRTEAEKTRGADHAAKTSMAHLTRAWSMLLKGIRETELHADPLMAAEMVLIRLAHAADFPGGEDLARLAKQAAASTERVVPLSARDLLQGGNEPVAEARAALAVQPAAPPPAATPVARAFAGFKDILALAAEKRDIKLKADLESLVRPIRVSTGQVELALEPNAHPGLPGELARKLEVWTGIRWMVMVAKDGGEKPIARQRQESRDSLFNEARNHPDIQAVLKKFPGAEIVDVREPEQIDIQTASETDEESR
jgi:DNA polymerase-3 subunit gamma/tau